MNGVYGITEGTHDLIRLQIVGALSVQAVETMLLELEHLARRAGGRPRVLVDLTLATNPTPVLAHGSFIRALRRGCRAQVAVFGAAPLVNHRAQMVIQMARATDQVRFFGSEDEALGWLSGSPTLVPVGVFASL